MANIDENKVVLIGESGVGKTCIMNQLMIAEFDENQLSTPTAQFHRKNFKFPGNKSITLDIWDTAGQEKFRSLNKFYYKDAKVVILVYDISHIDSFNEVKNYWYNQIKENCQNDVIIVVAANKSDLYEERQVSDEDGEEFAKSIGAIFESTSAKNDFGITNLFENIAKKLLESGFSSTANEQKSEEEYENEMKKTQGETEYNEDNSSSSVKLSTVKKKKKNCC